MQVTEVIVVRSGVVDSDATKIFSDWRDAQEYYDGLDCHDRPDVDIEMLPQEII